MNWTDEQISSLHSAANSYFSYVTDPWRCDFCDYPCTCDEDYLDTKTREVIDKHPELQDRYEEVSDYINRY